MSGILKSPILVRVLGSMSCEKDEKGKGIYELWLYHCHAQSCAYAWTSLLESNEAFNS
jgi:hypothetical protein